MPELHKGNDALPHNSVRNVPTRYSTLNLICAWTEPSVHIESLLPSLIIRMILHTLTAENESALAVQHLIQFGYVTFSPFDFFEHQLNIYPIDAE
jgi:hypothetical protein